ncbi:glycosyltransferase [Limnohabitans sp. 2KL-17]|uniref:glycosyltransferase n=1 Tax=Limnohabitans sp. 2KL-17 TaxID=1100704 RepID=UPI0011B241D7|nr:glycosyltransferase [Limnohabitans sp. 2KL-17]
MQKHFTLLLPVYNEENRIERLIDYYSDYGHIIVIDNFSNDSTLTRAKERGCTVVQIANNGSLQSAEWVRQALIISPTQYVLVLSSSEFIPPATLKVCSEVARTKSHNMVSTSVVSYTCGSNIQLWDALIKPVGRRIERFYNRDELDFDSIFIHAPFKTKRGGDILYLPNDPQHTIVHLRDSDLKSLTHKHLNYAAVEANQIINGGLRFTLRSVFKRCLSDLIRYQRLDSSAKGLVASRELWARVMLHFSIYFLVREGQDGYGIDYSRKRSTQLWESLVDTARISERK